MLISLSLIIAFIVIPLLLGCFTTVQQGTVAVITQFGKFKRIIQPGFSFKIPILEIVFKRISNQNKSIALKFQAITQDQANVYFTAMLLYAVLDNTSETIEKVAFKFMNDDNFMNALIPSIEGDIRSFVATKKQSEVLQLRNEIISHVKNQIDVQLSTWGYHLMDIQINDITFDKAITESMAQVVASNNLRAAAENQGQALLITKTKAAESEGNAILITAKAERDAAEMRGQGVALYRKEIAQGMAQAAIEMENGVVSYIEI